MKVLEGLEAGAARRRADPLEGPAGTLLAANRAVPCSLVRAIERDFGGPASLQSRFAAAVNGLICPGWIWLAISQDRAGRLQVLSTGPNVFPLLHGYDALLDRYVAAPDRPCGDRQGRAVELDAWWRLVNWAHVARRYERSRALHA